MDILLKILQVNSQSYDLSKARSREDKSDADLLLAVQNPQHALFSNKQRRASQILTYLLFKTQSMLFSATSRGGPVRFWLTTCSKPRACSCQQQAGRASQILTYTLFKTQCMILSETSRKGQILTYILFRTQSMLLWATSGKGQLDPDLHPV